ncbi:MAG TPA: alanine--glyoxylate aminotransferase family protein [Solirubrobacterales bacterium]|nr:alanine--glyoxylate aminotransferase family protein [Solirubrobacterales bacterium]
MIFQQQLRIPGPTPLPERVVRAMQRPLVDHRGPEFKAVLDEIVPNLKKVFGTETADMLLLTCSGTGGLESAVANLVSPGDQVIVALCGNFGERFVSLNKAYGAEVVQLEAEWGQPVDAADLADVVAAHPAAKLVFLTHNETSTGLTNPLQQLARVARDAGRVVVVDGVSSVGSMPAEMDAWGVDVLISGSQKGWMAPPGLAFMAVGPRAWELQREARSPRFYFDWTKLRDEIAKGATPYTPAVGVAFAVQEGLRMLFEEGLENVYRRHRVIADACAAALDAAGFRLFAAEGYRSATVTAALPPEGLEVAAFRTLLREKYGVIIAGGQAKMSGKMIRVGHLGAVSVGDLVQVLWAMEQALEELDIRPADGRTLAAAGLVLAQEATPALA